MAKDKDRSDKEKKKGKKEKKLSETDGVHKTKKEKKDKKHFDEDELTSKVLEHLDKAEEIREVDGGGSPSKAVSHVQEPRPVGSLVPFANPLVEEKVAKKVLKTVKKAAVNKALKRGVKEVVKAVRKSPIPSVNAAVTSPPGIVVLAADISPMDVISHIPVLCEDHGIPYVYVTSRADLGSAGATKRPTSVVMILPSPGGKNKKKEGSKPGDGEKEKEDFSETFADLFRLVQKENKRVKI